MLLEPKQIRAPEFGNHWLNSAPLTMRGLRGKAVLVDFWDYTCVNCLRTLPYLREWHRRYRDKGLIIIGVHAPEFPFARIADNVQVAVRQFDLEYPILLDNDYRVWQAFANRYWPAKYLIDHEGYIRYFHAGEGNYLETELAIQGLLREIDPGVDLPKPMAPVRAMDQPGALNVCQRPTPELYLGYERGHIANPGGFARDEVREYRLGPEAQPDLPELEGPWLTRRHYIEVPAGASGQSLLRLSYSAAEINLVMAPGASRGRLEILDDGLALDHQSRGDDIREEPDGSTWIHVDGPRMYSLVRRDRFLSRVLDLSTQSAGLQLYAFTFVSCVPRTT